MNTNVRKTMGQIIFAAFVMLALALPDHSKAQFTGDNQTNLISGVTNDWVDDYYVGSNYVFDVLLIENSGALSNGFGIIGFTASANSNLAMVSGLGSVWNSRSNLFVGEYGARNSLLVSNRGSVVNAAGVLGYDSSSSNNSALVTDLGSVWSNRLDLFFGYSGTGNRLVVSNRGAVVNAGGTLGYFSSSSNNSALVTDLGSVWSNRSHLWVGYDGLGNSLVISNRGAVFNQDGIVGYGTNSSENSVVVTRSSVWSNANLYVGAYGVGNSLLITNQGKVFDEFSYLGYYPGSSNNSVVVTGPGSVWSNRFRLYVGYNGAANSLTLTNQGRAFTYDDNGIGIIGRNSTSSNNSVLVTGAGSIWSNSLTIIGYSGIGNSLVISNQGKVFDGSGHVGEFSSGNSVLVTGFGSVWSNVYTLWVGFGGAGNRLVVSNQGLVVCAGDAVMGEDPNGSSNNVAIVTGSGSLWSIVGDLSLGQGGGNCLFISNGGKVVNNHGSVGYNSAYGGDNKILVSGPGSVWSNRLDLYFGHYGPGNSLVVSNQAAVFDENGYVGFLSHNNCVRVCDNGVWRNNSALVLGYITTSNELTIAGGSVWASNVFISYGQGASNNVIRVDSGRLFVTNAAGRGAMVVSSEIPESGGSLGGDGKLILNGGAVTVDRLILTNGDNSVMAFNGGTLHSKGTIVTNNQRFAVGDGMSSATFHLLGGVHSFNEGLVSRSNSFLTGCGTINGSVLVEAGSAVRADCGTLLFTGSVTNNGAMVVDGAVLECSGTFVNNGRIFLIHGGTTNFHGVFINNGEILNADIHLAIERDGSSGYLLRYAAAPGVRYRLQRAASVTGTWSNLATNTAPASGLIEYHDTSLLPGQAFYRTVQP